MSTWDIDAFYTRINPWKFSEQKKILKKIKIDEVIQHLLKVSILKEY